MIEPFPLQFIGCLFKRNLALFINLNRYLKRISLNIIADKFRNILSLGSRNMSGELPTKAYGECCSPAGSVE
jgi:hypothetical protein